jgi:hypothetical protein
MNHAASATPAAHSAPISGRLSAGQPQHLADADVHNVQAAPPSDAISFTRRPPVLGGLTPTIVPTELTEAEPMTGTTGPRPAIRRPYELGSIAQRMNNGPSLEPVERAMQEATRELNPNGTRKSIPAKELVSAVAEKLGVDEATARSAMRRLQESKRGGRQ